MREAEVFRNWGKDKTTSLDSQAASYFYALTHWEEINLTPELSDLESTATKQPATLICPQCQNLKNAGEGAMGGLGNCCPGRDLSPRTIPSWRCLCWMNFFSQEHSFARISRASFTPLVIASAPPGFCCDALVCFDLRPRRRSLDSQKIVHLRVSALPLFYGIVPPCLPRAVDLSP